MDKFLKNIEIKNFKSIKELKFDAKKVNIFIGKPNVGKSNILEALSLFCAPYYTSLRDFLSDFIRYENFTNIYYDEDLSNKIEINSNILTAKFALSSADATKFFVVKERDSTVDYLENQHGLKPSADFMEGTVNNDGSLNVRSSSFREGLVKKYYYKLPDRFNDRGISYLSIPDGSNLFEILKHNKELYKDITPLFKDYGLSFVLKIHEKKLEIQKNIDGVIYTYPYSNIADTLQRYIFYLAAIKSNTNSVLLLEEPEVHSFPPYTWSLAEKIIQDETNQYFITTHSPYMLTKLLENLEAKDLNVFITYYENYETKLKLLSDEDITSILTDSIDIFFNMDRFLD